MLLNYFDKILKKMKTKLNQRIHIKGSHTFYKRGQIKFSEI
jgi:predicted RNA binding protein YcfA (HicA-like mRNA interferase family)